MASKIITVQKSNSKKTVKTVQAKPSVIKVNPEKAADKYAPTKKQLSPLHIAIAGNIGAGKNDTYRFAGKEYEMGSTL